MAERIFRGFLFLGRRISSRILSPGVFSSFLWEKSAQKNPPGKSRQNPPNFIQQKSPTHFCRGAGPTMGQNEAWVQSESFSKTAPESRDRQGGGKRGGGQNLTRRPPTENSFRPPHLSTFPPPPPIPFLMLSPLETPRISGRNSTNPHKVLLFGKFCLRPPWSSGQRIPRVATRLAFSLRVLFLEIGVVARFLSKEPHCPLWVVNFYQAPSGGGQKRVRAFNLAKFGKVW